MHPIWISLTFYNLAARRNISFTGTGRYIDTVNFGVDRNAQPWCLALPDAMSPGSKGAPSFWYYHIRNLKLAAPRLYSFLQIWQPIFASWSGYVWKFTPYYDLAGVCDDSSHAPMDVRGELGDIIYIAVFVPKIITICNSDHIHIQQHHRPRSLQPKQLCQEFEWLEYFAGRGNLTRVISSSQYRTARFDLLDHDQQWNRGTNFMNMAHASGFAFPGSGVCFWGWSLL